MKKSIIVYWLCCLLLVSASACKYTGACATYSRANTKGKFHASVKKQKKMSKKVYMTKASY